jgi:Arc/MetJ-type ribon-helix-helix transcriptional regulator
LQEGSIWEKILMELSLLSIFSLLIEKYIRKYIYILKMGVDMKTLTVKVDEELKERMKRLRHVNWSEVIRESIRRKIEEENGRNIAEAVLINERLRREAPEGWDSAKVIREWRLKR